VQLLTFIRADLASFRPEDDSTTDPPVNETSQNPTYPKSLLLINPLFSTYELNSVNTAAQDSIPVPESLDLDTWIVPPPREYTMPEAVPADYTPEGERTSVKKKHKGKGNHKGKEKLSQAAIHSSQTEPIHSPGLSETEEDKAELEKAS
jgi:AP-3 complex subunit delta-1